MRIIVIIGSYYVVPLFDLLSTVIDIFGSSASASLEGGLAALSASASLLVSPFLVLFALDLDLDLDEDDFDSKRKVQNKWKIRTKSSGIRKNAF